MFPDLTPLLYFAAIGLICALGAAAWVLYHIARALLFYIGAF